MSTCARGSLTILVFARAPVPGKAKTRLIPRLGREGAAHLHERLTIHTLSTAVAARIGPIQLWCSPNSDHPFFTDCSARFSLTLHDQRGATLGDRMAYALCCGRSKHAKVLLIGTDCPGLTTRHLQSAQADLEQNDAVIVPAEDGGYVLLGLSKPIPGVFTDIDWGSERVYAQTMTRLAASDSRVAVHDSLWDVDLPADYERLQATCRLAN